MAKFMLRWQPAEEAKCPEQELELADTWALHAAFSIRRLALCFTISNSDNTLLFYLLKDKVFDLALAYSTIIML